MALILFMAPLRSPATLGRISALSATGYPLSVVDLGVESAVPQQCYPFSEINEIIPLELGKIDPFYSSKGKLALCLDVLKSAGIFPENRALGGHIEEILDRTEPCVVVTYFGPVAIRYARLVKKLRPGLPVVCIFGALPSTIELSSGLTKYLKRALYPEYNDYRFWFKKLDGLVYTSVEMKDFASRKFGLTDTPSIICPDFLPKTFQPTNHHKDVIELGTHKPNLIFLGAPERWGTIIDSIDDQFMELAMAGVNIYSGTMREDVIATGYGHIYPRFSDIEVYTGHLAKYASGFDAALITYNVRSRHERFRSTFPTRFSTALSAGVPIVIKKGIFDACERFVRENEIGYAYESVDDLVAVLADKDRIEDYRHACINIRDEISAESQGDQLRGFLTRVIQG